MRKLLVVAVLVAGCKKDKAAAPPAPSPKAPASTAEQDALWALAPEGAIVGVVASSRAIGSFEGGWLAVKKLIAGAPEMAPIAAEMDKELTKVFGSPNVTLADVGLAPGKGAALFAVEGGGELVIVPLANRDKFLSVVKGSKGADKDTIDDHTCKTAQNMYACAKPAELLDRLGKGKLQDKLKLVGARGDIEVVAAIPAGPGPIEIASVVQIDRGSATVRGAVKGVPAMATSMMKASKPAVDPSKTAGFSVLNVAPILAAMPIPPEEVIPGVTVADLAKSVNGPISVTMPPGAMVFDIRIPMSNTAPAQKLVEQCDQFPVLQLLGATVKNGVCHVSVPQMQTELDAWIEGKELRIGKKGAPAPSVTLVPSAAATELAQGEWTFVMYGRGTMLGEGQVPPIPMMGMPDEAKMAIRMITMLNELGFGVRADGDTVRFLATLRTAWANPDDVVAKIIAVDPMLALQGKAAATGKAIAASAPQSPFASDFKAGIAGVMIPTAAIGVLAAVAIPAFMQYQKKSKKPEALLYLTKLEKNLKTYAIVENKLPKGSAPLTPAKSCCETQGKCFDPSAWQQPVWQQLDMQIDEPHMYRYSYESDGKTFTAKAVADLDCDGTEVAYVLQGTMNAQGEVTTVLTEPASVD